MVFLNDQLLAQLATREQLIQTPGSWWASDDGRQLFVHLLGNTVPEPEPLSLRPAIASSPLTAAGWAISHPLTPIPSAKLTRISV